jgi:hypothetical protein
VHVREDVAAGDVDLAVEHHGHRAAGRGDRQQPVERDDVGDLRFEPVRPGDHRVAYRERAGLDAAEVAAALAARAEARTRHELHREAEVARGQARVGGLEHVEEGGAFVPSQVVAAMHHHVALQGRHRDERDAGHAEGLRDAGELRGDLLEHRAVPADLVHLVHGDHHARDREQRGDRGVAARLLGDAARRVDQDHRESAVRSR